MPSDFRAQLRVMSNVVLLFGALCYLTSCTMDVGLGGISIEEQLPPTGGTIGPIEVDGGGTVLEVDVGQLINRGSGRTFRRWSFITVELLDAQQNYLMGFGGEMWHEAGYDDGYWREAKEEYSTKVTIPQSGTHYLRFNTESDVSTAELSRISVDIEEQLGSSLPFHVAAIIAFIAGGALWWKANTRTVKDLESSGRPLTDLSLHHLREGDLVDYEMRTWEVVTHAKYDYEGWPADEWTLENGDDTMFLEHEDGTYSLSRPVDMADVETADGTPLRAAVRDGGDPPDAIRHGGTTYTLDENGPAIRTVGDKHQELHYWVYASGDDFLALERYGTSEWSSYAGREVEPYEFDNILPGEEEADPAE